MNSLLNQVVKLRISGLFFKGWESKREVNKGVRIEILQSRDDIKNFLGQSDHKNSGRKFSNGRRGYKVG